MAIRDRLRTALPALALWLGVIWAGASLPATAAAQPPEGAEPPLEAPPEAGSGAVTQLADWVIASGDNRGLPFVLIDKVAAQVLVYGADGQLRGVTPALIGSAHGDNSTPGVGDRELSDIAPEDRTTPAGRFIAAYGPALGGKTVLWVDYATAISLHPVVTANRKERRLQRLKSASAEDNRITYGCINVSAAFYQKVVRPTFKATEGVVYILPESTTLAEVFPSFRAAQAQSPTTDLATVR
jgi:hypothetical protein